MITFSIISLLINVALSVYDNNFYSILLNHTRQLQSTYQIESSTSLIYGNSSQLNYYYINIFLGNNKTKQSLILDTGSQITAIPCKPLCEKCGRHLNSFYELKNNTQILPCEDPRCSKLNHNVCSPSIKQCSFNVNYGEGSALNGVYFEDLLSFGDGYNKPNQPYKIPIGCITEETKHFINQSVDGIIGLSNSDKTIISYLYNEKLIPHNVFSLCFSRDKGYFTLGDINSSFHQENITYISIDSGDHYRTNISKIKVNNDQLNISSQAIIDSGTTLSYFPKNVNEQLSKLIVKNCKNSLFCNDYYTNPFLGLCFKLKSAKLKNDLIDILPNITFIFNDKAKYTLFGEDYYFEIAQDGKTEICLGLMSWEKNNILLGGNFMHNHDIIFNKENKQIGFARSLCSTVSNSKNNNNLKTTECKQENSVLKAVKDYLSSVMFVLVFVTVTLSIFVYYLQKGKETLDYKVKDNNNTNGTFQTKVGNMDEIKLDKND